MRSDWKGPVEDQGDDISMDLRSAAHRFRRASAGRGNEKPRLGLEDATRALADICQELDEASPGEREELCEMMEREMRDAGWEAPDEE